MSDPPQGAVPYVSYEPGQYRKLRTLSLNATTSVLLVERVGDGAPFVLKRVTTDALASHDRMDPLNEVRILSGLRHPHILQPHECFVRDGCLHIVMDYAPGGDLAHQIHQAEVSGGQLLPERLILHQFCQILSAVQYIHSANILHRDLKPHNVFLMGNGVVKVGDFGVAKQLTGQQVLATTVVGTPQYLSPELCEGEPYGRPSDVWALGCLLHELCALRPPFEGSTLPALMVNITQGRRHPLPATYSSHVHRLVTELLQPDAHHRPSADQLLQRDWLRRFLASGDLASETPLVSPGRHAPQPAAPPPAQYVGSNAQWIAQKWGEILGIQEDLEAQQNDKLQRRLSAGRFPHTSHRRPPTSMSARAVSPYSSSGGTPGKTPLPFVSDGDTERMPSRRFSMPTQRPQTTFPRSASTPNNAADDPQRREPVAKGKPHPRAKSPGAVLRCTSDTTTPSERRPNGKQPPSRETLVQETEARKERRETERLRQQEARQRHREGIRNAQPRVKVDRRGTGSNPLGGAPVTTELEVEVFVRSAQPRVSPPRQRQGSCPSVTFAPSPPASSLLPASAHRPPQRRSSSVPRERCSPHRSPPDGESVRTPSKTRQQFRQQVRADREAGRARPRGTEGIAVELFVPHCRTASCGGPSVEEGVHVHYKVAPPSPLKSEPDNADGPVDDDDDDGPLDGDDLSPAPAPSPSPQPASTSCPRPPPSRPPDTIRRSAVERTEAPTVGYAAGSHSAPSSDESPGNVSPLGQTDDSEDDLDAYHSPQALLSNSSPLRVHHPVDLTRPAGPLRPAASRQAIHARGVTLPASPNHLLPSNIPRTSSKPTSVIDLLDARATCPFISYARTDADRSTPMTEAASSRPSSAHSLQEVPRPSPPCPTPHPPSPHSASNANNSTVRAGAHLTRSEPTPALPSNIAADVPGRTESSSWSTLLQYSNHRRLAGPADVDQLLDRQQQALLPHDTGPGGVRDLKALAPEDRLKIRIKALQLLGQQVLGPRLFSLLYDALKRPAAGSRADLLAAAQSDPVFGALVEHTTQLLLCESLYFG